MKRHAVRWLIVAAFAGAVGHLGWHAHIGPALTPSFRVEEAGPVLAAPDPEAPQLYLRHALFLGQRPVHAWIQLLGQDQLQLVVNGRHVDKAEHPGFGVAVVADLTPYLRTGHNVIAIAVRQASLRHRPVVSVKGPLEGLQQVFERHPRIWYVGAPSVNNMLNTPEVSDFLRQHMEVVHEDVGSVVLFRSANHRPADLRNQGEEAIRRARMNPPP
jgi:hypothetical protein